MLLLSYRLRGPLVAARAAVQVLLVAASSVTLSAYQARGGVGTLGQAGVIGFLISWLWWSNARAASRSDVAHGRLWYASGAAVGTLAGAALARFLVG